LSNEDVWRRTNYETINIIIKRRKWKWSGHTLRKPQDDITRQALEWNPAGKRKGRPRRAWRRSMADELQKAGKTWSEIKVEARNRVQRRPYDPLGTKRIKLSKYHGNKAEIRNWRTVNANR
jgi:hypothetical protein